MLELYHHGSSACAAKVRLVLAEKQLDWQGHYVDILKGEQFEPDYLAINPKGVVPVLVDEGAIIPESTIICEYLEDRFPELPLYPDTPLARARARAWTKAVDEELHPACSALTYTVSHRHTILRNGGGGDFESFLQAGSEGMEARKRKWQWLQEGLQAPGVADQLQRYDHFLHRMEEALQAHTWLVGEEYSIADLVMTPYLNRLAALAMQAMWEEGRLPRVAEWFRRIQSRASFHPAMLEWMPRELTEEMYANGQRSWPEVARLLDMDSAA